MRLMGKVANRQVGMYLRLVVVWLLALPAQANHIIGGDLSMQAVGTTPGLFRLQLNQFWDETQTSSGNRDPSVTLLVFRKQNPILVERIDLSLREALPLTFDNVACASARQLNFTQARYYGNYQFNLTKYSDPGGYYIVWERCCRNSGLTNVNTLVSNGVAMTFYLEFPAMQKNSVNVTNSSPEFRLPNGSYICINKLFSFDAKATDADGDQLRYSLVTPLNGYTTSTSPNLLDDSPRSSYPTISWAPGYSLSTIIPGNPSLRIDANTGTLTVRASTEGLYLFTVQCEEFRNGERIGVVRRDFQLPVVDCSKNTPPPAVIAANGNPAKDMVWCSGQPLVLSVTKNSIWAYQWQKDGANLRGSVSDTLQVRTSGVYTVVKSLANACANDTVSQAINVTVTNAPALKLSLLNPKTYCTGDTATIQTAGQSNTQYRWRRDGRDIAGEQQTTLRVMQTGTYSVSAKTPVGQCESQDSLNVVFNALPTATISASTSGLCSGDSLLLTAYNSGNYWYSWQQDGVKTGDSTNRFLARQPGTYQVRITAPAGCTALSNSFQVVPFAQPTVRFDSIPPVCLTNGQPIALLGQPTGGAYAGSGVQGNQFNPETAGLGRHVLTYTITSDKGCRARQNRWVEVLGSPELTGETDYWLAEGKSVQLLTGADQPITRYQWSPSASLSQANVSSPIARPTETTQYSVSAVNAAGCIGTLAVLVTIYVPLYVPSAFSPNADSQNDVWTIPNISLFPACEVTIYNRWGELIFFSRGYDQPWDGTYRQERVPAGVYTYQIRTGVNIHDLTYRGQLTVVH